MARVLAVVARPGQDPRAEIVDASLEGLQALVGGWIEVVHLGGNVVAVVNEEGILEGLPWCVRFVSSAPLAGNVVILGETRGEEGMEFTGLDRRDAALAVELAGMFRMDPTPSSLDALEELTGQPAIRVTTEDGEEV